MKRSRCSGENVRWCSVVGMKASKASGRRGGGKPSHQGVACTRRETESRTRILHLFRGTDKKNEKKKKKQKEKPNDEYDKKISDRREKNKKQTGGKGEKGEELGRQDSDN